MKRITFFFFLYLFSRHGYFWVEIKMDRDMNVCTVEVGGRHCSVP